jgi:cation transport ATPase
MNDDLGASPETVMSQRTRTTVLWQNISLAWASKRIFLLLAVMGSAMWMAVLYCQGASCWWSAIACGCCGRVREDKSSDSSVLIQNA